MVIDRNEEILAGKLGGRPKGERLGSKYLLWGSRPNHKPPPMPLCGTRRVEAV